MDDVKNQLVKDVAELKPQVVELGAHQITEGRVREIVKEELEAAKPPLKTRTGRLFTSSSRIKKSQTQKEGV